MIFLQYCITTRCNSIRHAINLGDQLEAIVCNVDFEDIALEQKLFLGERSGYSWCVNGMVKEKPNGAVHKIPFECHVARYNLRRLLNGFHDFLIFTIKIDVFSQGPKASEDRYCTTNNDDATRNLRGIDVAAGL